MSAARPPKSDTRDAIERELEAWPTVAWAYVRQRRHWAIRFAYAGAIRTKTIPCGPVSPHGAHNAVAQLRQELRAMGATRHDQERKARA